LAVGPLAERSTVVVFGAAVPGAGSAGAGAGLAGAGVVASCAMAGAAPATIPTAIPIATAIASQRPRKHLDMYIHAGTAGPSRFINPQDIKLGGDLARRLAGDFG
jgi:hypothetical protein